MMDRNDHLFMPDHVDEQIEYYTREWPITPESQLLAEMHQVAQQIRAEQNSSLQRTWLRLQQKSREHAVSTQHRRENAMQGRQFIAFPPTASKSLPKKPARPAWRALSISVAAAVVALTVLSWALFTHAFWQSTQPVAPPTAQGAYLACSVPDTVAPLGFGDSENGYHLNWSATGKIAFTYWGSLAVNGVDCTRDNHYQNNLRGVQEAVWSPDGKYLLVQASAISSPQKIDTLYILDSHGKVLASTVISQIKQAEIKQTSHSPYMGSLSGGGGPISSTFGPVWSADDSKISEIFSDGVAPFALKSWTWDAPHHALTLNQLPKAHSIIDTLTMYDAVWSPDGKYIAVSLAKHDYLGILLDAHTGAFVRELKIPANSHSSPPLYIDHLVWSPDGKELAAVVKANVLIVQASTGKVVRTLILPAREVADGTPTPGGLAWSPDGKYLAVGYYDTSIWDAQTGKEVAHINASGQAMIQALAWSPDSRELAIQVFTQLSQKGQAVMYIWEI